MSCAKRLNPGHTPISDEEPWWAGNPFYWVFKGKRSQCKRLLRSTGSSSGGTHAVAKPVILRTREGVYGSTKLMIGREIGCLVFVGPYVRGLTRICTCFHENHPAPDSPSEIACLTSPLDFSIEASSSSSTQVSWSIQVLFGFGAFVLGFFSNGFCWVHPKVSCIKEYEIYKMTQLFKSATNPEGGGKHMHCILCSRFAIIRHGKKNLPRAGKGCSGYQIFQIAYIIKLCYK